MRRRCFSRSTIAASDRSTTSVLVRAPRAFWARRTRSASTRSDIWSLAMENTSRTDCITLKAQMYCGRPPRSSLIGGCRQGRRHSSRGFLAPAGDGPGRGLRQTPSPWPSPQRGEGRKESALGGALDPAGHGGEGFVELGGILAAGLGEIGPAAAASADELGHLLDELAGP